MITEIKIGSEFMGYEGLFKVTGFGGAGEIALCNLYDYDEDTQDYTHLIENNYSLTRNDIAHKMRENDGQTHKITFITSESRFIVRDREAGNEIDEVDSMEEGLKLIQKFEEEDKAEGIYEEDFYEVVEKE